jgi:hypothetical protein
MVRDFSSSKMKTVVAAWLVVIAIGATAIGSLSALERGDVPTDSLRPAGHWSVPRAQGIFLDDEAGLIFLRSGPWFEPAWLTVR